MVEKIFQTAIAILGSIGIFYWIADQVEKRRVDNVQAKKELLQRKNARIKKMARVLQGMNRLEVLYSQRVGALEGRSPVTVLKEFRDVVKKDYMNPNTYSDSLLLSILNDIEEEELNQR
ncbi:hypothetical protein KR52_10240 [Synechococcus sp. KORDI-52]|uniref:hypothetical protein n=1 Tax=Synechococcus sp. KORDI-52 TaxID=585425 RepID=UPI0004E0568F|nr:hypothetical protein [Synechococcus sp. KORDI-52]AII49518.1 hypothetical protein KR52_10240 [Synechococcus sp. KORDI-52]